MVLILPTSPHQLVSRSSSFKGLNPGARRTTRGLSSRHEEISIVNALDVAPKEHSPEREREAEPHEEKILAAIRELYSCSSSNVHTIRFDNILLLYQFFFQSSYDTYSSDALFCDSDGNARPLRNRFDDLHKRFSFGAIQKFRVLQTPISAPPSSLHLDIEVEYFRDIDASLPSKTLKCLVALELSDSDQRIVRHSEKSEHKCESPIDDVQHASEVPRRMSVSQRKTEYD
ncbi:hypothetical protein OF83DRAFT_1110245 [Amylostereum chailletii]|nr:hypothetical protein OF83DRAFT_1110245 [Amylostereum chailletii]